MTETKEKTLTPSLAIDQTRLQRKLDSWLRLPGCWLLEVGYLCWIDLDCKICLSSSRFGGVVGFADTTVHIWLENALCLLF